MNKEIKKLSLDKSVDTCPVCQYGDGFHVSFKVNDGAINIILICPDCHARFDPQWEAKNISGVI